LFCIYKTKKTQKEIKFKVQSYIPQLNRLAALVDLICPRQTGRRWVPSMKVIEMLLEGVKVTIAMSEEL
jgi:hypothetical protein